MKTVIIENISRPTVVLGDIHGSTYWKTAVKENPGCRYIFLGDYLDPYEYVSEQDLITNLTEIIQLKKDNPDDVLLLLGNHDLHYFCLDSPGSSGRFNYRIKEAVEALFNDNLPLFTYAFQEDKLVFTHAGISHKWFITEFKGDINKNIADQLNNPTKEQLRPLHQAGEARGGGWCTIGGIFWADISELDDPLEGYIQYAGHNRVGDIREVVSENGGQITFCDCLYNKIYLKLSAS
jgi:hypothetical protein